MKIFLSKDFHEDFKLEKNLELKLFVTESHFKACNKILSRE
jgi:hypothetical protein